MKLKLLVVGKTNKDYVQKGLDDYFSRLQHYISLDMQVIPQLKNTKNLSFEEIISKEGELILKEIQSYDHVVLLDERGDRFTSKQFADFIEKKRQTSIKRLTFVVGGAYGFSNQVNKAAHETISLSNMTFSHQLVRLIFAEQIYRAMTILNGEPYHHE